MVVTLAGCSALVPDPTSTPLGGTWHVAKLNGVAVDHADAAVIQFTVGGEIQGSSGCHDFRGPVRVGEGRLEVGALTFGTGVPCAKATQDAEGAFLTALRRVAIFRGGRPSTELVLEGDGGAIVLADGL
jgi:heat shock protein HslJ